MQKTFIIILALIHICVHAQSKDSAYFFTITTTGTFNKTNETKSFLLSNQFSFSMHKTRHDMNFNASHVFGQQQQERTNNDLSLALDYNRYISKNRRFYSWALGTYDKTLSLSVNSREQAGVGLAYSVIDTTTAYLNISDGIVAERLSLQLSDSVRDVYSTTRNSLRIRARVLMFKRLSVESSTFWQPSLQYTNDYVIKSSSSLSLKLNAWLSLSAQLIYNKVAPVLRENFLTTFGLRVDKYL